MANLDRSQILIAVYGEAYAPDLEDEYRGAAQLPRLIYVKQPADRREPRLSALLDMIKNEASASYRRFHAPAELRDLVQQDLAVLLSERFAERGRAAPEPVTGHLPAWRTRLIGRDDDVAALADLLLDEHAPLVTLVGTGGIGKTRLATAAAERVMDRF